MSERSEIVRALFEHLDGSGIIHCVAGDTRGYPHTIPSDIDIVVPRAALRETPRLIAQFARERDLRLVQAIRHEDTAMYFVLAWLDAAGQLEFIAPDFCSDYLRRGRLMLTAEEILAQREVATAHPGVSRGFYVPAPHIQFIYYLLKKIDKQELTDHHGRYLSAQWHEDPGRAHDEIRRFWRAPTHADLIMRAAATEEWALVRHAIPQLRRALHRAAPISPRGALGEIRRAVDRALRPTGVVVAFLGPDGCGKSSVIQRVGADLAPAFRRMRCLHLRPRLLAGTAASAMTVTDPHGRPARGRAASVAKLAYFALDYLVGYAARVWPLACRSTLVMFDRYYHDLLIDSKRYRYGGSMRLARVAAKCVPPPDMWVLLDAPAQVLQARKREVTPDESERQRRAYLEFARELGNAVVIDASRPLDRVAAEVAAAVLRFQEERIERRYGLVQRARNPLSTQALLFVSRNRVPVLNGLLRLAFNCDIAGRVGAPIFMPNPRGVAIHRNAVIGNRVTIMQQVTIGGEDPDEATAPVIEDDVYIGVGAKIVGAVRVGQGAIIGAAAVVTRDVPPYCSLLGADGIVRGRAVSALEDSGESAAGATGGMIQ